MLPAGVDWLEGPLARAFDGADELVTEIADDPGETPTEQTARMQALVTRTALLPPRRTLRGMMGPGELRAYEAALAGLGLPPAAFDRFKPWFAAVTLDLLPLLNGGYRADAGVEAVLGARAARLGRRHTALETAAFQIGLFDALPLAAQRRYLDLTVGTLPTVAADAATMLRAWAAGDADTLAALINAGEDDPALVKALITDRNRAWAGWIARRLDTPGTVFVAVGAGHLAGANSVQAALAARGLAVVRVQ